MGIPTLHPDVSKVGPRMFTVASSYRAVLVICNIPGDVASVVMMRVLRASVTMHGMLSITLLYLLKTDT